MFSLQKSNLIEKVNLIFLILKFLKKPNFYDIFKYFLILLLNKKSTNIKQ